MYPQAHDHHRCVHMEIERATRNIWNREETLNDQKLCKVCMHKMSTLFFTALLLFSVFSVISAVEVTVSVDGHAVEGQQTRLVCTIERTDLENTNELLIAWEEIVNSTLTVTIVAYYNNTVPVIEEPYNDRFTVEGVDFQSILVIDNTKRTDNNGTYQCFANILNDQPTPAMDKVKISVAYLSYPTLVTKNLTLNEGDAATFMCVSEGNPKPSITWLKDDKDLNVPSETSLVLNMVTKSDEGNYKCRAENNVSTGANGKLSRETATLTVISNESSSTLIIIGIVIGLVVLVAAIVGGFSYKNDKLCFSRNAKKASGGGSENIGLNSNFSDVQFNTYAQVQKPKPVKATKSEHSEQAVTQTKPPDKPQRAPSRDRANVEQLTYADLDLVKSEGKIIHTDPETEYSSVRSEKQLTYADLDLTKDVNTGSKGKIIRTQPETEYSSVMITKK
ncbi:junctional adhesion molecule B-like [Anneissia japonica]|uniref:junctional adhesion molecule B-like n=1 Tax=Anneissia japonica TaxID=1529436 RepID=UPI0014255AAB|nr:junctional adhesion molecule B-like [Anneissia japonica]